MIELSVSLHGPVAEGYGDQIVDDYVEDLVWEVGAQGLAVVNTVLNSSIQNPTPYYETMTTLNWGVYAGAGANVIVHDRGIIYGPWLEGIGSRNFPKTSFRGYHAFEKGAIALNDGQALRVAHSVLPRYMARLRGEG
jgi:hypothetical protein